MKPRSTRDIEILFKLIVKVPVVMVVGNTADIPNPPGIGVSAVLPTNGTFTINLTSISAK